MRSWATRRSAGRLAWMTISPSQSNLKSLLEPWNALGLPCISIAVLLTVAAPEALALRDCSARGTYHSATGAIAAQSGNPARGGWRVAAHISNGHSAPSGPQPTVCEEESPRCTNAFRRGFLPSFGMTDGYPPSILFCWRVDEASNSSCTRVKSIAASSRVNNS